MIRNKSLKFRLLVHYLIVQIILFFIFGSILIYMLKESVVDKIETNLKIITLDIKDDVVDHYKEFEHISLDDEMDEFQVKPLYIKIHKDASVIQTKNFPNYKKIEEKLQYDKIYFKVDNHIIFSVLKFKYLDSIYKLEVATTVRHLPDLFPNLRYIILFLAPIVLLFAIILGNFIITRSFKPIDTLLEQIKNIGAKSLSSRVTIRNSKDEIDQISSEVNKLLERVEKAYTQISQFTSDASHELKTPLTIIRGELEVALKEQRSTDEYKSVLKTSLGEILNIQKTIETLLLISKMENKDIKLDDIIYLDELLLDVTKELKPIFKDKECELNLNIKTPISINGDENLFKIVLKNIIENSVFYSSKNSKVNISLYTKDNLGYIEVEDFGIGMDRETKNNIFEKFYRGDTSRSKHTGGTGLGMSIVKKISELHNVDISIESQIDKGTKIKLSFKHIDL